MKRRWIGGLVSLACLATLGYTVAIVAATPEEMIRRPFTCPGQSNAEAKDFQVLTVRKWAQGIAVLSRGSCLDRQKDSTSQAMLSYQIVKHSGMEWNLISTGSSFNRHSETTSSETTSSEKPLIEYNVGRTATQGKERHTIFYGEVLSPAVSAVEVTFNNGKVLRDTGLDGMLLLVAPGATGICDVRMLGVDNQILHRDELLPIETTTVNTTCQPISGQL
ncbi:MAG TPA: hypothetical protein VL134_11030 [Leptolyngbya sp.]|jgi:hypothetical protein|nr:hypothetical protein [Leptolyngbya sp.]